MISVIMAKNNNNNKGLFPLDHLFELTNPNDWLTYLSWKILFTVKRFISLKTANEYCTG